MGKMLKDKRWLCLTLLAVIALFLLSLEYAETDDSLLYTLLSKSLIEGNGFNIEGKPFEFLPMFSFVVIPFALLLKKYLIASKIAALFLGVISAKAWFLLGKEIFNEKRYFVLLFFSPFFALYAVFRPLSEASLICFSLLSLLFFIKAEKKPPLYYVSGLFLGFACLSRLTALALGGSYFLFMILKKKKLKKEFVLSSILGYAIFGLWLIRNYLAFNSLFYVPYGAELAAMPLYFKIPYHFAMFSALIVMFGGIFFIPFLFKALKNFNKDYNPLFILIIASTLLVTSIGNLRIRYIAPLIPFFLLLVYNGYASIKKTKMLYYLFIIGILFNIAGALYFVNGYVKDAADTIYTTPPTWGQVGLRNAEAIDWINNNVPSNSVLITRNYKIWNELFREDIITTNHKNLLTLSQNEVYLFYDYYADFVLNNYLVVENEIKLHRDFLTQEEYKSIYEVRANPFNYNKYDEERRTEMLKILKTKYPNAKTLEQYLNENYVFEKIYSNKEETHPETIVYRLRKK